MPQSEFLIQVVHRDTGDVVSWAPGLEIEKQFETELIARVQRKGVGILRTSAHVAEDLRTALRELLFDLKSQV